ncbi:FHA domain-containing protein FhaA [Pontiella desulfatans]|uniref:FHA domain-containing protein FhaA n=1 Tax=Pontiella desulfatans TaxID=2750659 RepID=A0A6C2TVQ1_PONDE|nr:FHA domain-containing protein [Pontiella desulfatans]VGO11627.1 FHA domain-containing protein FhaA [Pontiella desulfatans]
MKEKDRSMSDTHLLKAIQAGTDETGAFFATRDWGFDRLRASVDSRGDPIDRDGAIVLEGDGAPVLSIPFARMPATIGSGETADYRLEHAGISRLHCLLEPVGSLVRIRDKGSTNGVLLNGKKVKVEELCDGDELQLGSAVLRIRIA